MANSKTGANSPFGGHKINTEKGAEKAISDLSSEIARRTPQQSMTAGMIQTPGGAIHAPKRFGAPARVASHPWKVTANGDDTVTIAAGKIIYPQGASAGTSAPNSPYDGVTISYAGGTETVDASGILYVVASCTSGNDTLSSRDGVTGMEVLIATPESLALDIDPTLSGHQFSIPIADLDLTDSIATVEEQILSNNPFVSINWGQVS